MHGDLSALVKSAQKIRQNRLTHLCVAMVNCLGDSNESPMMLHFKIVHKDRAASLCSQKKIIHIAQPNCSVLLRQAIYLGHKIR